MLFNGWSFANPPHRLKCEQYMHVCAATTPLKRAEKTSSDHAHTVPYAATASRTFFWRYAAVCCAWRPP